MGDFIQFSDSYADFSTFIRRVDKINYTETIAADVHKIAHKFDSLASFYEFYIDFVALLCLDY